MYTLNATEVHCVAYGIGSYASNAWKSSNPHSGVYEADTARTLDALNCGYPACNQGGWRLLKYITLENHPADSRVKILDDDICQTLSSRMGTGGGNVPMVIEVEDEFDSVGCAEQAGAYDR